MSDDFPQEFLDLIKQIHIINGSKIGLIKWGNLWQNISKIW